jgi:hypothetical protein
MVAAVGNGVIVVAVPIQVVVIRPGPLIVVIDAAGSMSVMVAVPVGPMAVLR